MKITIDLDVGTIAACQGTLLAMMEGSAVDVDDITVTAKVRYVITVPPTKPGEATYELPDFMLMNIQPYTVKLGDTRRDRKEAQLLGENIIAAIHERLRDAGMHRGKETE